MQLMDFGLGDPASAVCYRECEGFILDRRKEVVGHRGLSIVAEYFDRYSVHEDANLHPSVDRRER